MTKIENFATEVMEALQEDVDRIEELCRDEITKTAKEALKTLKNHPKIPQKTGDYKKSFALKKTSDKRGEIKYKLYSKSPKFRISHLLEYGYAKRSGGRVKAYPHWKDAQNIADELPERLKRRLEGGT